MITYKTHRGTSLFADAASLPAASCGEARLLSLQGNASLFSQLTFPRLRPLMAKLPPHWFAIGAVVAGLPVGLALGFVDDKGQAELVSLIVATAHRRRGLGQRLLETWMADAVGRGALSMSVRFVERGPRHEALCALLVRAGWTAPVEDGLFVLGRAGPMVGAVGSWAPVSEKLTKQSVYSFDPLCLTAADEQRVKDLLAVDDAAQMQGPLRLWPRLEPEVSCLVRRQGELVGWVLAGPASERWQTLSGSETLSGTSTDPLIEYFEAFLDPSYWHTAIAVGAYFHCYRKQAELFGPQSLALYYTDTSRPRMVHLTRRRFAPIADRVETILRSHGPSSVHPAHN